VSDHAIGPYWDCDCFTDGADEDKRRVIRASAYDALAAELAALQLYCAGQGQTIQVAGDRIKVLEAALRSVNATMRAIIKRNQGGYIGDWDAIHHTVEVINAALASAPETPPHLRGPIIQAYADTNGVPPQAETPVDPTHIHKFDCPLLSGGPCDCDPVLVTSSEGGKP
jgi:hypothetical protein